nr:A disintegrin and metalloproteinase with thrombospondin motifs 7-like [Rhipicephalus microplus]
MKSFNLVSVAQLLAVIIGCRAAKLPKYRAITYPQVFDGRDENTKVLKINDDISLNLEPISVLHEDFFIRTYRNGVPEHHYHNVRELQKDLYHDKKRYAAVMLSEEDGAVRVEGVVGANLKIRPIETAERSDDGRLAHLVENIEEDDSFEVYGKVVEDSIGISERAARSTSGFDQTKYNVYEMFPEVFVVCDSWFQAEFVKSMNVTVYMIITFQVVSIRYSALRNPKVYPVLRGIELSTLQQEKKYYVYLNSASIDGYKSLLKLVTFVTERNDTYQTFDMVYFVTRYDMVAVYDDGSRQNSLQGYAFVGSACSKNREQLGEDTAYSYRGIRTMTHELAHALGCSHDGTAAPGIVTAFTPDSLQCPWEHGYIMSYYEVDIRSMQFSRCCRYDIQRMSWAYEGGCLHKNNSNRFPLNWINEYYLPGENLSLNRQCEMKYPQLDGTYYLEKVIDKWYCQGYCYVPEVPGESSAGQWDFLFMDGTTCHEGYSKLICINGECRADPRRTKRGNYSLE